MSDVRFVTTTDNRDNLTGLMRRLPGILSGRLPDEHGIAHGFRTRIGFAILNQILPNFDLLGRGECGADGTRWPPLSREYLAYGRRFGPTERRDLLNAHNLNPKTHRFGPGNQKGLLTSDQLKLWRRTYADRLAWYIMREPDEVAKGHAAAIAWIVTKRAGGKTKLEVFGDRRVQILVDTGYLRGSLLPGTITESNVDASYNPPVGNGTSEQVFDINNNYQIIVGTNVEYAKHHHFGKGNKARPLWPNSFPEDWWNAILGVAIQGLQKIGDLYLRGA